MNPPEVELCQACGMMTRKRPDGMCDNCGHPTGALVAPEIPEHQLIEFCQACGKMTKKRPDGKCENCGWFNTKPLLNGTQQIPEHELIEDRWYVGRGRNSNVALWCRAATARGFRMTFLTVSFTMGQPVVKDEGYYYEGSGCFQPFKLIDEGTVIESVGTNPGWDQHYAKKMAFGP